MEWLFFIVIAFIIFVLIKIGNQIEKKKEEERKRDFELFDKKKQEEKGKYIEEKKKEEQEKREIVEQRQKLEKYKINYLYHMTHKYNLENILRYGLKSHNEAKKENLNKVDISDNQVNDRRSRKEPIFKRSIHDYVPLYFNPKNPMLYVRKQLQNDIVILAMNPMLLYNDDALFTDGNAASNPTKFYSNIDDLEKLTWDCINSSSWSTYQDGKRLRCSEVLVYPIIKTNQILKIFCNNSTTEEFAKQKIGNFVNGKIPVEINYDLYF